MSISTVPKGESNLKDELETGAVDLAIGWLLDLNAGMFQLRLTSSQLVCAFHKGHALDKGRVTLEEFARANHLVVLAAHTGHMMIERDLERALRGGRPYPERDGSDHDTAGAAREP